MKYDYIITLEKESDRYINRVSLLLCFLSACSFIFFQFHEGALNIFQSLAIAVIGISIFSDLGRRDPGRTKINSAKGFGISLLVTGICWLGIAGQRWLCIPFFLMSLLDYQARQSTQISFGREVALSTGLIKKRHGWSQFSNIILKDALLTLDFRNNRIIQKEISTIDPPEKADDFNLFCLKKIETSQSLPA